MAKSVAQCNYFERHCERSEAIRIPALIPAFGQSLLDLKKELINLMAIMNPLPITSTNIFSELLFSASRSSGPGGQNVNKVSTKITLRWDIVKSQIISEDQRSLLLQKLSTKLTSEGVLLISAQDKRSQLQNKEEAIGKLDKLLDVAFKQKKIRKPSKPSKAAKRKRVENKKKHGEKKDWRRRV
jgi:ribosome-associated protein